MAVDSRGHRWDRVNPPPSHQGWPHTAKTRRLVARPRRRPASAAEVFRAWMLETPEKRRNGPRIFAPVNSVLCRCKAYRLGDDRSGGLSEANDPCRAWQSCVGDMGEDLRRDPCDQRRSDLDKRRREVAASPVRRHRRPRSSASLRHHTGTDRDVVPRADSRSCTIPCGEPVFSREFLEIVTDVARPTDVV
jgi:hypothetical protein